ncbi:MAG: class I SAM-dependent methyltransferase [Bryobacterales bacterium]|nr:class I SAM-dependent methyltransferase [Bryobacterales bacterium]
MTQHLGAYNEVLYPSFLAGFASPDRLAVAARLRGIDTAPPDRCRMLELGCGDGASVIAFAYAMPGSRFVGVDLAARPVEIGQERIRALGLANCELRQGDVMDLDAAALGEFDYIFAHGLISWVPDAVRDRVLDLCRACLAPQGILYLSYNAYPGGYQRDMLRAMLRRHTAQVAGPREKVAASHALLDFIAQAPFPKAFHEYVEQQRQQRRFAALLYDELGDENHQYFLTDFAALAGQHGLCFAGPVQFDHSLAAMPAAVRQQLQTYGGGDPVAREQYLDYLTGASFRQDVFCRAETAVDFTRRWQPVTELYCSSMMAEVERRATDPPGLRRFQSAGGPAIPVPLPGMARAFAHLGEAFPRAVPFAELAALTGGEAEDQLALSLLQCAEAGAVQFHAHPHRHAATPGERPRASALARLQTTEGFQSNLLCEAVQIDRRLARLLFPLADGSRTPEQLAGELAHLLSQREAPDEETAKLWSAAQADPAAEVRKQLQAWRRLHLLENE